MSSGTNLSHTPLPLPLQVSPEEWESVMKALMKGNADLADAGYQGQGHFYKCANGHPYVIDNCGGATQVSTCPECGVQIGGTNLRVDYGSARHEEMSRMARELGHSRY